MQKDLLTVKKNQDRYIKLPTEDDEINDTSRNKEYHDGLYSKNFDNDSEMTDYELLLDFLWLAFPSILASIGDYAFYIINILYAGRLGDENKLAGVGLGQAIAYVLL